MQTSRGYSESAECHQKAKQATLRVYGNDQMQLDN